MSIRLPNDSAVTKFFFPFNGGSDPAFDPSPFFASTSSVRSLNTVASEGVRKGLNVTTFVLYTRLTLSNMNQCLQPKTIFRIWSHVYQIGRVVGKFLETFIQFFFPVSWERTHFRRPVKLSSSYLCIFSF